MSTLKQRLLELRSGKPHITNADLAREAGVKAPSVSGWFSGATLTLKGKSLNAVCRLYGANSEWVEKGVGPKYKPPSPHAEPPAPPASPFGPFEALTPDEMRFITDFRFLLDEDKTEYQNQIAKKSAAQRAHLAKLMDMAKPKASDKEDK